MSSLQRDSWMDTVSAGKSLVIPHKSLSSPTSTPGTLAYDPTGKAVIYCDGTAWFLIGGTSVPIATTDNAISRFNGTAGTVQDSLATLSDAGELTTPSLRTNTIAESTATNGVQFAVGSHVVINDTTTSSSTTTGALVVAGDAAVAGSLRTNIIDSFSDLTIRDQGSNVAYYRFDDIELLRPVNISNATASVSTASGALIVSGGAGIAGELFVGGTVSAATPTLDTHLATKLYVDNLIGVVSADALGGDVVGPTGATDNALARFDETTGKLIQNSLATLSDGGELSAPSIKTDTIVESTTASGVTIDGVLLKDSGISFDGGTNTLDNYVKKSTWTPTLAAFVNLSNIGTATQCNYTRIGPLVFYDIQISGYSIDASGINTAATFTVPDMGAISQLSNGSGYVHITNGDVRVLCWTEDHSSINATEVAVWFTPVSTGACTIYVSGKYYIE